MSQGHILFLNGVTSSGKTTLVEALQCRRDVYFYVVANDLFEQMVGEDYLQEDYWGHLAPAILLMYRTAAMISDLGHHVLIDGILVERPQIAPHYRQFLDIMGSRPVDVIEVACPVEVCEERNLRRGDRREGQSREQAELMNPDILYSMRVETDKFSPDECAEQILQKLFAEQNDQSREKRP